MRFKIKELVNSGLIMSIKKGPCGDFLQFPLKKRLCDRKTELREGGDRKRP